MVDGSRLIVEAPALKAVVKIAHWIRMHSFVVEDFMASPSFAAM